MELRAVKAVVTGGASGLGRFYCERLIAAGSRVALLDRRPRPARTSRRRWAGRDLYPRRRDERDEVGTALQAAWDRLDG